MNFRWEICSNLKTNIMFLFTFYSNTIFQVSRAMYKADTHSLMLLVDNANFVLRFSSGSGAVADLHSRRASPPRPNSFSISCNCWEILAIQPEGLVPPNPGSATAMYRFARARKYHKT